MGALIEDVLEGSGTSPAVSRAHRRARLAGLLIVLAVSVPPFLIASTMRVFGISGPSSGEFTVYRYLNAVLIELTSLALLLYVLSQNGRSLADLGLRFRFADVGHGTLLIIGGRFLFRAARWAAIWLYQAGFGHSPPSYTSSLVGSGLALSLLFAFINPFFEECIVRAFLISETTFLTGSFGVAIALSVLLQTAYHLYQGMPNAVGLGLVFLVYSVYYVRTRRLWPLMFAHLWSDLYAVIFYSLRAHSR
jgi:membrane protease YdiL (CAAX protease family)